MRLSVIRSLMADSPKLVVKHDEDKATWWLDGLGRPMESSPRLEYDPISAKKWNLAHTETPTDLRGKGYAEIVVKHVLNYCKANEIEAYPGCSYVKHVMTKL
jgi:predicted GNAT family acetyltransferase